MGPLIPLEIISESWGNVFAVIIGIAFGFVLESSGFSSTRKLMGTFFGYDFVVLRVFFTAAITAAVGLLYLDNMGYIDFNMLYTNPTYVGPAIVGGVIMGIGFAMGGYCPGTSYCGAAIGKIDAIVFSIGLFFGILIFSESFPLLESFYNSTSLGAIKIYDTFGISASLFLFLLIVVAVGMFIGASWVRRKVKAVEY